MSSLGFNSDKLARLEGRLDALVGHATVVQADALGVAAKFNFGAERVSVARQQLANFAEEVLAGLREPPNATRDIAPIVTSIVHAGKEQDWIEDVQKLAAGVAEGGVFSPQESKTLQRLLDLLRREVATFSNRLRKR